MHACTHTLFLNTGIAASNRVVSRTRVIAVVDASFLQIRVTPPIVSDRLDALRVNWQGGR